MNPGVISKLRDFVPIRPLNRAEAMRIAELQALRFLELVGVHDGPVPERVIAELPRIQVERVRPLPVSGASNWASQRWLILLNAAEPLNRQRFSLAHELKHILDHRFVDVIYRSIPDDSREAAIEGVCDYFAGCLLMPRPWVKRAWGQGVQTVKALSEMFGTSEQAMVTRLNQLGLATSAPRCSTAANGWTVHEITAKVDSSYLYRRSSRLVAI